MTENIRPQTSIKVGGKEFIIFHWSPTKVYRNMPTIGLYFATPVSMVLASTGDDEAFQDAIPTAVQYLFQKMEQDDIINLIKLVLSEVYYQNQVVDETNIDNIFAKDPQNIVVLMAKVLEISYGPFFKSEGLKDLAQIVIPMAKDQEQLFPQS